MNSSKIGVHGLGGSPAVLTKVGVWVNADPPANLGSNITALWRWVESFDPVNDWMPSMSSQDAAIRWIALQWKHIQHVTKNVYIIGPNEPTVNTVEQCAWIAQFERWRMYYMQQRGYRCCIFNFSVGNPSMPQELQAQGPAKWSALLPGFSAAFAYGGIYGRHGYSWPSLRHGADYLVLRHKAEYVWLKDHGCSSLPVILTECGIDPLIRDELKPFPGTGAFRDSAWRDAIRIHYGANDPDKFYFDEMVWLDKQLNQPNELGFCIFTGPSDSTWKSYDITGQPIVRLIEAYLQMKETTVAKFVKGQDVWLISSANVNDIQGDKIDTLDAGTKCRIVSGPRSLPGKPTTTQFWEVDPEPVGKLAGYVNETVLDSIKPGNWSTRGKMHPQQDRTLPLMSNPFTDSQIQNLPEMNSRYLAYDGLPTFARGINFYHTSGLDAATGERITPAGFVPCRWLPTGNSFAALEIYPSDGKNHPLCNQQVDNPPPPPPPTNGGTTVTLPPVTLTPKPTGTNILLQGSFDVSEGSWKTDTLGNQEAPGFTTAYTRSGDILPHPTKLAFDAAQGKSVLVEARAGGWGEYKFVLKRLLPIEEQPGGRKALILVPDGNSAYKDFSDHVSHALILRASLTGTPGTVVRAWLPILGETLDAATKPDGKLEVDHWRVQAALLDGATTLDADERTYAEMVARREIDLDRCWNVFTPFATFPASGRLTLEVWTQQNWPGNKPGGGGGCDFFFSSWGVFAEVAPPPPPPTEIDLSAEIESMRSHASALLVLAGTIESKLRG